ncbi:hypothetical protein Phum_PHUM075460 [Pediculus humanus corporis]|uniref:Corticotropin-releasing factor domain-containing protein n=1 Tax=Pediculus humanus subsp. corporis TaxID=121224 RepID=E0VBY0_PEDHC|nr:uncharacterized protein Phum_PHUM075460 [Pediculus humanus corporis]EEB10886.1 hypothetical protein Phum_PHUM075460 [Pediculus humanus corporis]
MPPDVKDEEFLLGKTSNDELTTNWDSPQDFQNLATNILEPLDKFQDERKDTKIKRMKTSLSIDNPLDVLRQQYYRALARRMKFKSIEKNREHLIKTGKRTDRISNLRTYIGKRSGYSVNDIEKGD